MESKRYDVVLAGYGPVGALIANLLGKAGVSVLVVDRMADIYDKPRAINIDHEVMRALQWVGLADIIEPTTIQHPGTDFIGMGGRTIKVFEPPSEPYPLHWPPNLMFIQPEFEPVLRQGVMRFPAVTVLLETAFLGFTQTDECVTVTLQRGGESFEIQSKYLIGCDGGASGVRKQLGVTQDSLDFDEWWTVIDAWQTRPTALPRRTTQFCIPEAPATYVVGPRTLRRWEIKVMPGETPDDFLDTNYVRKRLSAYVDPDAIDLWRVATYRFHALVANRWKVGRVFLVGDAAHQMPPFMAQGLCSGMRDAINLAWKLSGVLQGLYQPAILDTYEAERKPHISRLTATAKELGVIIGELDLAKARLRDETLGGELDSGRAVVLRQKLIPDLETGMIAKSADGLPEVAAGTLFPQPEVRTATESRILLDDIVGDSFLLVTANPDLTRRLPATGLKLVELQLVHGDDHLERGQFIDLTGTLRGWMAALDAAAVIVRPDKYVFGIARSASEFTELMRQLEAVVPT